MNRGWVLASDIRKAWSDAGSVKTVKECSKCGRMKIYKEDQRAKLASQHQI